MESGRSQDLCFSGRAYSMPGEISRFSYSTSSTHFSEGNYRTKYTYDYMGRRFRKVVNGVTNNFMYDGWAMIRETSSAGTTNTYVYGLDLSGTLQGAGTIGGILSASFNGTNAYFCYDANGNVGQLIDGDDGTVVAQYEYSPYGEVIRSSGPMAEVNPYQFSTKYFDQELGLLYYGFRYYRPGLGRWLRRDPIGDLGGINLYCYTHNSPINGLDRLGMIGMVPVLKCAVEALVNNSFAVFDNLADWTRRHTERIDLAQECEPDENDVTPCALCSTDEDSRISDVGDSHAWSNFLQCLVKAHGDTVLPVWLKQAATKIPSAEMTFDFWLEANSCYRCRKGDGIDTWSKVTVGFKVKIAGVEATIGEERTKVFPVHRLTRHSDLWGYCCCDCQ